MTFRQAVEATPAVCNSYRRGLQALGNHSSKIQCDDTHRLTGSVNLEDTLKPVKPNSPLWDYGIGYRHGRERAIWIEVHPASSTHVEEVLRKLNWLRDWLRNEAPRLDDLTQGDFYWISTDSRIAITANSPHAKRLAKHGLKGPQKSLRLP